MLLEQAQGFPIQLLDLLLHQPQLLQRHLQQPTVDFMEFRAGAQRMAQLFRRGPQPVIGQSRQRGRVGFPFRQCLQHAPRTDAQQIRHKTRQLDVRLFQQTLQLVPKAHLVAGQLVLAPRHRSPEPLFRIRHEAQNQFLRHQPLDHPFAVGEVVLPPLRPAVGFGLAQVQCAGHLGRPVTLLPRRFPVPLQRAPYRLAVLRGRFHNHFLDLLLDQPLGEQVQLIGGRAELAPLKFTLAFPGYISHHYRQHLLVHVDCCDSISHHVLLWRSGEHARKVFPGRVTRLSSLPTGDERRPIIRAERACSGSNRRTVSTSLLSTQPHQLTPLSGCHSAGFSCSFAGRRPIPTDDKKRSSALL